MKDKKNRNPWKGRQIILAILAVLAAVVGTILISWVLYQHTVNLLTENLRQREISIVQTAAVRFDWRDLEKLQIEQDWHRPEWERVVGQLIDIRKSNEDIEFAYILRKSKDDPTQMVFVADSHSLDPYAKIDLDENGVIDDADALNWPGQIYEDVPPEAFEGYEAPTANRELYQDQWGVLISGYAPIKDDSENAVAIMVVDIRADDFFEITRQTFLPFMAFIGVLILILLVLVFIIVIIWNKRIQLIEELDRQKDELLSIVSHQLATPISSVKWYIEMMLDGDLGKVTQEQEEHLKSVQSVAADLSDLCSMILDVSRIQLGRIKVDPAPLELDQFFKEILNVIEPKAKEKGVEFAVEVPQSLPTAMLDKRMTRMTIENLLSNAVKYTPKGGHVKFLVELHDNDLYCEVKDDGCGIPKKDQAQIFGKLFRASNVRNQADGNGFGLYIAKGAIEAQGGKIWFESEEGKGTCFCVLLPLKAA